MSQYSDDITDIASPGSLLSDLHVHHPTYTKMVPSIFTTYTNAINANHHCDPPFTSITHISNQLRVCGIFNDATTHLISPTAHTGQLVDSGANINITNRLDLLSNAYPITPFNISVAVNHTLSSSGLCTHKGLLSLTLDDGDSITTTCYYCPTTVETIISPQAVLASSSTLCQCSQVGFKDPTLPGQLTFCNASGSTSLTIIVTCKNGLYYSHADTYTTKPPPTNTIYKSSLTPPTPTTKAKQTESELWLLRLGSPNKCQLTTLPTCVTGLPHNFE